jgi:hypothetical protein
MRARIRLFTLDPIRIRIHAGNVKVNFERVLIAGSPGTEAVTSNGEDGEDGEEVTLEASREGYYPNLDPLPPGQHRYTPTNKGMKQFFMMLKRLDQGHLRSKLKVPD